MHSFKKYVLCEKVKFMHKKVTFLQTFIYLNMIHANNDTILLMCLLITLADVLHIWTFFAVVCLNNTVICLYL